MRPLPWIVLTGPAGTGKTTLGAGLAAATGRPFADLDAVAAPYYAEAGWSPARLRERIEAVGRVAAEEEWEPARVHAVRRVLADHPGAVVALGAGHTSYRRPWSVARVRDALRPCPDVVRILPSPDPVRSLDVLRHRCAETKGTTWIADGHDFLAQWLHDPDAAALATRTVHTGGDDPQRTVRRLLAPAARTPGRKPRGAAPG